MTDLEIACAIQRLLINNQSMAANYKFFMNQYGVDRFRFMKIMDLIDIDDTRAGRLMSTARIVNKETKRPGNGFFELAEKNGHDISDRVAFWESQLPVKELNYFIS